MVQDWDIKTGDEGTTAEIESIMSEIDTADTQLNTPCSTKEPKPHRCSDRNATAEPSDCLVSPSITPFEDRERRSVDANVHNRRTLAIVDSTSTTVTTSLATEQYQGPGGPAEIEEQEWEITEILEKRAAGSETEYRVRWKDTCLLRSELGSAQGLLKKFKANGRAQHGRKRGRPARTGKGW